LNFFPSYVETKNIAYLKSLLFLIKVLMLR
jgi:hypothetical protein